MRICYALLSANLSIHQYTADLANRMAVAGHDVHLVTTARCVPRQRYAPAVTIHTPVETTRAGPFFQVFQFRSFADLRTEICDLDADIDHLTGPHLWNVLLVRELEAKAVPVVYTLHSVNLQRGLLHRSLLRLWNTMIIRSVDHILVHNQMLQQRLRAMGVHSRQVTCTPLLYPFFGGNSRQEAASDLVETVTYEPWALFFGHLKRDKGIEHLMTACAMMDEEKALSPRVVIVGPGDLSSVWSGPVPASLAVHNRPISHEETLDLFSRCGLLVVLHMDAIQPALIATAYWFRKPVLVARTGALPEYVQEDHTGCVVDCWDRDHVTLDGNWRTVSKPGFSKLLTYYYKQSAPGAGTETKAVFDLPVPEDGRYDVYLFTIGDPGQATKAPVEITHADGTAHASLDQSQDNIWVLMGNYRFRKNPGTIVFPAAGANGPVAAHKVGIIKTDSPP